MKISAIFKSALSYREYRGLVDSLVLAGKTTGNSQSEKLVEFTKLNVQRMNRLDKTINMSDNFSQKLRANEKRFNWLLIGDAWCGDCAQIIPVINKIAEYGYGKIKFNITSRDTYPDLIATYHTNGAKAIPKLLVIDPEMDEVLCTWGPRPQPAQNIMMNWRANADKTTWEDFEKELHLWYAKDKGTTIINELLTLIITCEKKIISQQ